jgi:ribosomal protein S18 acetylase RimI-like enzyme
MHASHAALDNPIWHALTTAQRRFARARGDAASFPSAVTRLAGLRAPTPAAFADLAAVLEPDQTVGLFLEAPPASTGPLSVVEADALLQMVHDGSPLAAEDALLLGPADHDEMRALAAITRPGPFGTRTHELGTFYGAREGGALVAMAGQRQRLAGLIEVSAICTHPDHLGRGHAQRLTARAVARVAEEGAQAFLHVRSSNRRAIALYERLGFRARRTFQYVVLTAG